MELRHPLNPKGRSGSRALVAGLARAPMASGGYSWMMTTSPCLTDPSWANTAGSGV